MTRLFKYFVKVIFYSIEVFYIFLINTFNKKSFYIISPRLFSFIFKKVIIYNRRDNLFFIQRVRNFFDINTVHQIFGYEEYDINNINSWNKKIKFYIKKFKSKLLIVDCGSNIGSSSRYFTELFKDSKVVSIEPDKKNFNVLKKNVNLNQTIILNKAVGSSNFKYKLNSKYDPRAHQIIKVKNKNKNKNKTITINQILKNYKKKNPFIIKIDIEGFEDNLFQKNFEWMSEFKIIIIEIHDWMIPSKSISRNFINSLAKISKKNKRDLIIQGENLISIRIK